MYQQIKKGALALSLSLCCVGAFAQKTITGNVKDATGEPLIGVTIQAGKGGTVTDIDGNFSLQNLKPGDKITISYLGCKTQTITVGNQSALNIVMQSTDKSLDEVVVIGYGTMKRRDLTGAVASVTGDKLAANPVANIAEALQGQLPGVSVTSQDGRPGATMSIRVRGGGSITQSNDPLFIVDGVQVSRIDDIPADNIESIDVLKDAASTAIYGARGANGVIMITTKSAKEGKAQVKYNMYYSAKEKPTTYDTESAYDYVLRNWSYATSYGDSYGTNVAKYFGLGSENGNHLEEYRNMGTHNYQDDLLSSSHAWNHDLSISGGTEHTKYYASINYTNDKGSLKNTGFRRWNANFKLAQDITKNLKWNLDARYSEMRFQGNQFKYATSSYAYRPIDTPLGTDDPSLLAMGDVNVDPYMNPVSIYDSYTKTNTHHRLRATNSLTWTPIKGLTGKTELTLARNWRDQQTWDDGYENKYNHAQQVKSDGYNVRWSSTINYAVQGLGEDHKLDFLVGNEVLSSKSTTTTFDGYGYPLGWDMKTAFGHLGGSHQDPNAANKPDTYKSEISIPSHTTSWFGRANYSYLGRYLFTATFRADGSSKFAPNHHWGYFPAAAAAWRISDEPWMKGTQDWLSNLKLRLSVGASGNDDIHASLFETIWEEEIIEVNGQQVTTYKPGDIMANPDLKWETTISRNLGLDFGFWDGRLRGSLDFYWNTTKDILMKVPVDTSAGYDWQFQNVGKTSNKGIELALSVTTQSFFVGAAKF
nr:SusC/RagA family TonB-linked outer membrane protein [Prevotella sp.]